MAGPPAAECFSGPDPATLPALLAESVDWQRLHGDRPDDAVLNACRALVRAHSGRWHSKDEAGELAAEAGLASRALVAQALDGRAGGRQPTPAAVYPFLVAAEKELRGLKPRAA